MEALLPLCCIMADRFTTTKSKGFRCFSSKIDLGTLNRSLSFKRLLHGKKELLPDNYIDSAALIQKLSRKRLPQELLLEMRAQGFRPDYSTLSALLLCYADNALLPEALRIWDEIINSSCVPDVYSVVRLIDSCGGSGDLNSVSRILRQMHLRDSKILPDICLRAISCFGKRGELGMMEFLLKEMVSMGFSIDSDIGNAYIVYYSIFGPLTKVEEAYGRLKKSRILIEEEAIRAIAFAYIKKERFYDLGMFVRDVGLGRRNAGNLLWNLLLLSYAAKFKMKSLQREFVLMMESGFRPDLTTFNIRALAFSKMSLFWDLHLSLEHMKHEAVDPDLVTFGCVVDTYLDRRLGRNLDFALGKLEVYDPAVVATDPFVFKVMGKGDFHLSSEAFLEFNGKRKWTYKELVEIYLKKKFRSNQIFWNY